MIVATTDIRYGRGAYVVKEGTEFVNAADVVAVTEGVAGDRFVNGKRASGIPLDSVEMLLKVGKLRAKAPAPSSLTYEEPTEEYEDDVDDEDTSFAKLGDPEE